jgi:hypothetical protein
VGVAVAVGVGVFVGVCVGVDVGVGVGVNVGGEYNIGPYSETYPSKLNVHGAALELKNTYKLRSLCATPNSNSGKLFLL